MLHEMMDSTGIVPKAIQSKPELTQVQSEIYAAFTEISPDRSYSMAGPLPIGLSAVLNYCTLYDLGQEESQDLWRMIRALDSHWLAEVAKRNPPPSKKT